MENDMNAFDFIRSLWIGAQLSAPPSVQRAVMPRLHEAKEIARYLTRPYLPVYQLQGQGQGGPLSLTFIGWEYAKPVLQDLLFVGKPLERRIGQIPFWHHRAMTSLFSSDIVIVGASSHLICKLPRQSAIVLPEFVRHVLDIQGDWEAVKSRFRKSVRYELRLTRKFNYQYEISHSDQDFERFYRDMYLPTMNSRHGELSSPTPFYEAYRYFRHGLLFLVKRDGRPVCGSVCYVEQDTIYCLILGVINADEQLLRDGVLGALNRLRIEWANQQGFKAIDFLGANPFLKTGMFQYKRKWGTAVYVPPHLHRQIWIKVIRNTPAVCQFLKENPFIAIDEDNQLYGLIFVEDPRNVSAETRQDWESRYATPGLSRLVIRSVRNFSREPASVPSPDLVIPIPSSAGGENR